MVRFASFIYLEVSHFHDLALFILVPIFSSHICINADKPAMQKLVSNICTETIEFSTSANRVAKADASVLDNLTATVQSWVRNVESLELLCDKQLNTYLQVTNSLVTGLRMKNQHIIQAQVRHLVSLLHFNHCTVSFTSYTDILV